MDYIGLVISDYDSTLGNSQRVHDATYSQVFGELGKGPLSPEHMPFVKGKAMIEVYNRFKDEYRVGVPFPEFARTYNMFNKANIREIGIDPMPGAVSLIKALHKDGDIGFAIQTSNFPEIIPSLVESLGLADDIPVFASTIETGKPKPDPSVLFLALDRANKHYRTEFQPARSVVLEDTRSGGMAALNADMKLIYVPSSENEVDESFENTFDSLEDVSPGFVHRLLSNQ